MNTHLLYLNTLLMVGLLFFLPSAHAELAIGLEEDGEDIKVEIYHPEENVTQIIINQTVIYNDSALSQFANITQIMNNDTIADAVYFNITALIHATNVTIMNNETLANAVLNSSILRNKTDVKFLNVNATNLNISGISYIEQNLGIGTNAPLGNLHIYDGLTDSHPNITIENDAKRWEISVNGKAVNRLEISEGNDPNPLWQIYDGGGTQQEYGAIINEGGFDSDSRIEGDTDQNLFYADAGTNRIGIGTSAPAVTLHLKGTNPRLRFEHAGGAVYTMEAQAGVMYSGLQNDYPIIWLQNNAEVMEFQADDDVEFLQGKMIFKSDGKFGIGTITPTRELHVVGDVNITNNLAVMNNINASGSIFGDVVSSNTFDGWRMPNCPSIDEFDTCTYEGAMCYRAYATYTAIFVCGWNNGLAELDWLDIGAGVV